MNLKGLDYEVDPITPFYGNEEFERLSPLRRIPVLVDGDFHVSDSSVICAYLDEAYPGHALFPADPKDRARARWFEEFADSRLGDILIWGLFYQKIVHPIVWGEPGDQARIEKSLSEDIPAALDYLEGELPAEGFPLRRDRRRGHFDRDLLPQWGLCGVRARCEAMAADGVICEAHPCSPMFRRPASLRRRAAQRGDQGTPPGAPRSRCSADLRHDGRARAAEGNDAALAC